MSTAVASDPGHMVIDGLTADERLEILSHLTTLLAPIDSLIREVPTTTRKGAAASLAQPQGDTIIFDDLKLAELAEDKRDLAGVSMRLAAANYRALASADLNQSANIRPFGMEMSRWEPATVQAFMAAEVGRLETQYATLYPGLGEAFRYDVAAVLEGMLGTDGQPRSARRVEGVSLAAYAFVALRPYLSVSLFNTMYDLMLENGHEEAVIDEIARIAETFVTLKWPDDADNGRRLASRLGELVSFPPETRPDVTQSGTTSKPSQDKKNQGSEAGKQAVQDQNDDQSSQDDQDSQEDQEDGQEGSGDQEGQEDGQGSARDQLNEELAKEQSKAMQSSEGKAGQNRMKEAAKAAGIGLDASSYESGRQAASLRAVALRGQLCRVFGTLIDQTAGGVAYNTKRGKLVPLDRKMGHRRYRSVVRPNRRNELSIRVALLIDISSSMRGKETDLGEAIWAIKGGIDDVARKAKGVAANRTWLYNTASHLMYFEGQTLHSTMVDTPQATGGTDPNLSLQAAKKWLTEGNASNRMLVTLTDGQWGNTGRADDLVKEIGEDASTILFGLDRAVASYGNHNFQHAFDINDLSAMPLVTRKVIDAMLHNRISSN